MLVSNRRNQESFDEGSEEMADVLYSRLERPAWASLGEHPNAHTPGTSLCTNSGQIHAPSIPLGKLIPSVGSTNSSLGGDYGLSRRCGHSWMVLLCRAQRFKGQGGGACTWARWSPKVVQVGGGVPLLPKMVTFQSCQVKGGHGHSRGKCQC